MPRVKGSKYTGEYVSKHDTTGQTEKENKMLRSFWTRNKVKDFMTLTEEEADSVIEKFMEDMQERQLARNPGWWYPSLGSTNDLRYTKEWREKNKKLLTKKEEQ